jgi:hypothetical protein
MLALEGDVRERLDEFLERQGHDTAPCATPHSNLSFPFTL